MVAGVVVGLVLGESAAAFEPLGNLFIRLLMMAAIPLVFFNLVAAIGSMTDVKLLGRLGVKIIVYYTLTTVVAILLGLATTAWLRPGDGMVLAETPPEGLGALPSVGEVVLDLVPTNVVDAFARGNVGQIVFFSVLLGFATALLPEERRQPLDGLFNAAAELFRKLVALVLRFGPIGIGALAAATVGQYGSGLFGPLARFLASVWLAQAIVVALYLVFVLFFGRTSPLEFLRKTGPLYATTAATCSSLASLAVSLELAEKRLKLPRAVYAFTLPLGAQFNKDGTAVMLGSVLLFTSQSAGIDLDGAAMVSVLALGLVLSQASSGIPGGGLVSALLFVEAFQLPVEIAAIVGGIYRLVDMGSTTVNMMGDLVGTLWVARSEALSFPANEESESDGTHSG